jgi:hypothetical protein
MTQRKDYEHMTDDEIREVVEEIATKVHGMLKTEQLPVMIVARALCINLAATINMVKSYEPASADSFTQDVYNYLARCIDNVEDDNVLPFKKH